MELTRFLIDCGKYLISVDPARVSSRNFHFVKEYLLALIADFGLRKTSLRAEACFAIRGFYRKHFKKLKLFVILEGENVVLESQSYFLV